MILDTPLEPVIGLAEGETRWRGIRHGWLALAKPAGSIRRHENRQAEAGEMVQRLIDSDQRPEPWVLVLLRHAKRRGAKPLGAVDRDVDRKIDQAQEQEPRRHK